MSNNPYGTQGYGTQGYGAQTTATGARAPSAPTGGGGGAAPSPAGAADLVKDTTTAKFPADVLQESRRQPVLVDFWAPWCGPCKQLTPILEKVVHAAGGRVKLVKMNIDEHPSIAGQLGVQSIPAVFAFVNGQPVDGFMGALPESEVKAFVDRLTGGAAAGGEDPVAAAFEDAKALLAEGDVTQAAQVFSAILQHDAGHVGALGGLADCYLTMGDAAHARAILDSVPADKAADPAVAGVATRLKLAEEIAELGDPVALQARIEGDADDHQARFDLALIAQARGQRDVAAGHLLEIIRRDRSWNEDGARRKLLEFFEAWGGGDAATKDARRKLSTLLFS
ncbi:MULTISPECIES: thioredoxin [unclassified Aureimonas]|uniref:thioredoxin n=1 Tax=unclassified Aureimonas TaxID=2615206 RepID=UPI0007014B8A|nr:MULTISPECIES: thioredoxin [unclassified Aureimonas]KQT60738.1 thioredoxin [Aureimonas sp. Leaf460]KQT68867.1 thioredoxin [Aureimonas sp. Leaf427]